VSAIFLVYTPETGHPGDGDPRAKPHVHQYDELPQALAEFMHAVVNEEWAELHWSS
jgi:hypothetical protein